jgi:hypothetical protein
MEGDAMNLELTPGQAEAIAALLEECLPELSHEIADTDNAFYRSGLLARRAELVEVQGILSRLLEPPTLSPTSEGESLERELAHPGG